MRFAIVPANGIGDGLIMLIAAHHLRKLGHQVTVFHSQLPSLGRWLEKGDYQPALLKKENLLSFDAALIQHDNSLRAQQIVSLRKMAFPLFVFYPTYRVSKHGPIVDSFDYTFDGNRTMVENCRLGCVAFFGGPISTYNGISPFPGLQFRKNTDRVLIHPLSNDPKKNWPKSKFLHLAERLQNMNFDPTFILSPDEKNAWPEVQAIATPTLEELATTIYESDYFIGNDSGPGHLASYLSIPHLIIGRDEKTMRQWRPGWHQDEIIYPPRWVPNFKGFRLRENKWQFFVSTNSVLRRFNLIIK